MRFKHIKVQDGLSQSSVNFVLKDKEGFYWIGTQYGLNKFNGKHLETYYTTNAPGLADNFILNGVEDNSGNLWFATRNNICRYDIQLKQFKTFNTDTIKGAIKGHNSIYFLLKDTIGNIIFNTAGKFLFITSTTVSNDNPKIRYLISDKQNSQATYLFNNTLYTFNADTLYKLNYTNNKYSFSFKQHSNVKFNNSFNVSNHQSNTLIISNNAIYKMENDIVKNILVNKINNTAVNCAFVINQKYYIGTDNGLYLFSLDEKLLNHYQNNIENSFSISENKVLSISQTNDGLLWIGNANTGLNISDIDKAKFTIIKPDENKSYIPFCCALKNDSTLYCGTNNGYDEFILDDKDNWNFHQNYFKYNKVTALLQTINGLLIGTSKGLFVKSNNKTIALNLDNEMSMVFDIKELPNKNILVSTINGIYLLSSTSFVVLKHFNRKTEIKGVSPLKTNYVFNSSVGKNNVYVNTTVGTSVFDFDLNFKSKVFENYNYKNLSEIMITKSVEETEHKQWYATLGNGIYKKTEQGIQYFNQSNGLSNNVVASLEKDNYGNVWASTNYGINCITKNNDMLSFVNDLNVESPEFITNGSYQKNNQLFFCSNSGLVNFNSHNVLSRTLNEKLKLNLVLVTKNYTDTLQQNFNYELKHTDKIIAFNFCVPTFNYYDKIQLQYRLIGFDENWQTFENGKSFSYVNLPFGNYTLQVKAELKQYKWEQTLKYNLVIKPPFWKQAWFILLILCFVIAIIVFTVWYFSRLKLKQQLVQMHINEKVYEEKERISQDLHDNIGSHMSALIMGIDKISITKNTDSAEKLSDYARNTLNELRNTIWALNTEQIDLETLKQKLDDLIFDFRTNYETITISFNTSINNNIILNPQQALTLFRIIQEAISNSLKYAQCKEVRLELHQNINNIVINIHDDGIGFDINSRKKGHYGLDNMQQRATNANIKYDITSEQNEGTRVTLTYQIT